MAKRFTDTTLYDNEWFRKLPPRLKCAWEWLCKRCDVIGVVKADAGRMSFEIGEPVTLDDLQEFKVVPFEGDNLFIPGFVPFQYGDESGRLSPKNRFHLSIAEKLQARGFPRPEFKPLEGLPDLLPSGIDTHTTGGGSPQGRGKGQGEGKGEEEGESEGKQIPPVQPITKDGLERCKEAWRETLRHFKAGRTLLVTEEVTLGRAIQRWGAKAVELAIVGARHEPKTQEFDPGKNFSLSRILPVFDKAEIRDKKFERFLNLGTQAAHKAAM